MFPYKVPTQIGYHKITDLQLTSNPKPYSYKPQTLIKPQTLNPEPQTLIEPKP